VDAPFHNPQDDTIPDLVTRLVDEGREVARAEVALYKAIAAHRTQRAKSGIVALVVAAVLGWLAAHALLLGAVFGLATLIGPLGAGVAVAVLLGAGAFFMLRKGLAGVQALSGDEDEREALKRGETIQ
jgi:hypothetical protein